MFSTFTCDTLHGVSFLVRGRGRGRERGRGRGPLRPFRRHSSSGNLTPDLLFAYGCPVSSPPVSAPVCLVIRLRISSPSTTRVGVLSNVGLTPPDTWSISRSVTRRFFTFFFFLHFVHLGDFLKSVLSSCHFETFSGTAGLRHVPLRTFNVLVTSLRRTGKGGTSELSRRRRG